LDNNDNKDLQWDLRQGYEQIAREHLVDIAMARKADRYSVYYKNCIDLKRVTLHKWKKKEESLQAFQQLINKAATIARKHPAAWLGQIKEPNACAEIDQILGELEEFLYQKMEEANMFGSNKKIPGL
jgi:hypothetical protein